MYFEKEKSLIDVDVEFFETRIKLYEDFLKVERNKNWWNEDMDIKQLENYFNRAESSIRKAIKKMCDNGFSIYKYLDNNKVIISRKGVEWICKNIFKQKYLELLEKYKMELTELYIKAGYPYDHFFHRN
nr:MAG TPA: winged helix-turn-helix transcription repressor [Caudoviricetes sp.]